MKRNERFKIHVEGKMSLRDQLGMAVEGEGIIWIPRFLVFIDK